MPAAPARTDSPCAGAAAVLMYAALQENMPSKSQRQPYNALESPVQQSKVIVIDYGSQAAQRIARRVREAGVYSEIHPCVLTAEEIARMKPSALILSGDPAGVGEKDAPGLDKGLLEPGVPILDMRYAPEAHPSEDGARILHNFLFEAARITPDWTMSSFIERTVKHLRDQVGDGHVVCALSGGIDSTVVAVLLNKALGRRAHCIFVDSGLLRMHEADEVMSCLREHFDLNLKRVQAQKRFLSRLEGVTDPEAKRKIIGHTFIEVFDEEAGALDKVDYLAQGTLYPDVIESLSHKGPSAVIKSHHNVGGLPEHMKLKLIEPVRELFKDEVRKVAMELGLPEHIVWRHPFPGPGLAVRVIGEVTEERLDILRRADRIVQAELKESGWYRKVWQGFAVLLPLKTVGVMDDHRTYEHVVALRVVDSVDAMTADWVRLPSELLERISGRIINEVQGVNRVVYDISPKPPSTIEWE